MSKQSLVRLQTQTKSHECSQRLVSNCEHPTSAGLDRYVPTEKTSELSCEDRLAVGGQAFSGITIPSAAHHSYACFSPRLGLTASMESSGVACPRSWHAGWRGSDLSCHGDPHHTINTQPCLRLVDVHMIIRAAHAQHRNRDKAPGRNEGQGAVHWQGIVPGKVAGSHVGLVSFSTSAWVPVRLSSASTARLLKLG